jgi:sucrose-6-phosphate hydrolase SacC (GH32 family)
MDVLNSVAEMSRNCRERPGRLSAQSGNGVLDCSSDTGEMRLKRLESSLDVDLGRRLLITASAALLVPRWGWSQSRDHLAFCWKLEERGDMARESVSGAEDAIASRTGHAIWVGEGRNRALRLDGYSVWFRDNASPAMLPDGAVTVTAWVALESYPVNEAALLELESKSHQVFRLSIDKWGFLQFGTPSADTRSLCRSSVPVGRAKWTHLAVCAGIAGTTLYQDGVPCGYMPSPMHSFKTAETADFVVGGAPDCPIMAQVFPSGVLNGLLRDVRVYSDERSGGTVNAIMADSRPDGPADLQINGPWCVDDPQRPICHAQPPRAWTNEPHGLIHWGGQYHIFYQKNANGPYWGHLNWGHMTSPDLLRWTEMPVAVSPEPGVDSEGCWSGSVIDHEGKLTIVYTAVDGKKACICLAQSEDGINFTKYPGNPVIPHQPAELVFQDFRDPFVWREGDIYYLVIGSGRRDGGGTAFLYRSKDLLNWEYRKQILSGDPSNSGTFWELPLFVKFGKLHALIVSEIPGRSSYWIGTWKDEEFKPLSNAPQRLELFNHLLAPTPMTDDDGHVVVMGIIPDERPPRELWKAGWAHLYSLPRVLSTDDRGHIVQKPHDSVKKLCHKLIVVPSMDIEGPEVHELPEFSEKSLYLDVTFRRGDSDSVALLLRRSPDGQEQTEILYDWERGRMALDRTRSSLDTEVRRDREEVEYAPAEKDVLRLEVFVDRSVLEVFVDDRAAFAARIYPTLEASDRVGFTSAGTGAKVENLRVARLERPA